MTKIDMPRSRFEGATAAAAWGCVRLKGGGESKRSVPYTTSDFFQSGRKETHVMAFGNVDYVYA
jgi:hypothetical protein